MNRKTWRRQSGTTFGMLLCVVGLLAHSSMVRAEGTETLGEPSILIETGTAIVGGGTGMVDASRTNPEVITFDVPEDAAIKQVLMYWNGLDERAVGDDNMFIQNTAVFGELIGGGTLFYPKHNSYTFRADITDLGLIGTGTNTLEVWGQNFNKEDHGVSVVVIIDDGGDERDLQILDGQDLAYHGFEAPLDKTVPQTFTFEAGPDDRTANMLLIVGSVNSPTFELGDAVRPSIVRVTSGGVVTDFDTILRSANGLEWDHTELLVNVPAGATSITVELLSEDCCDTGLDPASFIWITSALCLPLVPMTGEIGDLVYCDLDRDGELDPGEPGVEGVAVTLTCAGPDEELDTADDVSVSTVTDSLGEYLFTEIPAGLCRVAMDVTTIPDGKFQGRCAIEQEVTLEPGEVFLDADFCVMKEKVKKCDRKRCKKWERPCRRKVDDKRRCFKKAWKRIRDRKPCYSWRRGWGYGGGRW